MSIFRVFRSVPLVCSALCFSCGCGTSFVGHLFGQEFERQWNDRDFDANAADAPVEDDSFFDYDRDPPTQKPNETAPAARPRPSASGDEVPTARPPRGDSSRNIGMYRSRTMLSPMEPLQTEPPPGDTENDSSDANTDTNPGTASPSVSTVPESCQSVVDPEHPFYILRLGMEPKDPNARIKGRPLTVYEMLQPVRDPQARKQLLHAYWNLSGAIAQYKLANFKRHQYTSWIAELSNDADSTFLKVFQSAEVLAESQTRLWELHAIKAQHALAVVLQRYGVQRYDVSQPVVQAVDRLSRERDLPVPTDFPLVGGYNTQVHQMVQYRNAPTRIVRLDRDISLQKEILDAKFRELEAAGRYCDAIRESGPRPEGIIESHNRQMATQSEAIDEITAYNRLIADYVAETIGPDVTGQRLVRILLRTPSPRSGGETGPAEPAIPPEPLAETPYDDVSPDFGAADSLYE